MRMVISREIRPLAVLYLPYKNKFYRATISSFALSGRRGVSFKKLYILEGVYRSQGSDFKGYCHMNT